MTDRFIDLDWIVERLRAQIDSRIYRHLARIDMLSEAAQARAALGPGLLVVGLRTTVAASDPGTGSWRVETFGIITDVRDVARTPTQGRDTLDALRSAVDLALSGWRPGADWSPVEYAGGRLLGIGDGWYRHIDEYTTEHGVSQCP